MNDWFVLVACLVLGLYGVWALRREGKQGRASARGFSADKGTQPKRYKALTAFNWLGVTLMLIGAITEAASIIWRQISN